MVFLFQAQTVSHKNWKVFFHVGYNVNYDLFCFGSHAGHHLECINFSRDARWHYSYIFSGRCRHAFSTIGNALCEAEGTQYLVLPLWQPYWGPYWESSELVILGCKKLLHMVCVIQEHTVSCKMYSSRLPSRWIRYLLCFGSCYGQHLECIKLPKDVTVAAVGSVTVSYQEVISVGLG